MTSTASLHFGPEWMRKPARNAPPSSPNPTLVNVNPASNGIVPSNHNHNPTTLPMNSAPSTTSAQHSSYSSLLTTSTPPPDVRSDDSHPFRYSKEHMLAVWKEGGGQGQLGVEVERWPGIVREEADEPIGLKELSAEEKRLFTLPYNSDPPQIRRRGDSYSSHSPLTTMSGFDSATRNKLATPMRERYGSNNPLGMPNSPGGTTVGGAGSLGRRRKDENGQDAPVYRPRQLSLGATISSTAGPPSPGIIPPSPGVANGRPRLGGGTFDGVLGTENWGNTLRRRVSEPRIPKPDDKMSGSWRNGDGGSDKVKNGIQEEPLDDWDQEEAGPDADGDSALKSPPPNNNYDAEGSNRAPSVEPPRSVGSRPASGASGRIVHELVDPLTTQWQYRDPSGQLQGPFVATVMQAWFESGYFTEDLMLRRLDVDEGFDPLASFRHRVVPPGTEQKLFISVIAPKPQLSIAPPGLARPVSSSVGGGLLAGDLQDPSPPTVGTPFTQDNPTFTSPLTPSSTFSPGSTTNGLAAVPVVASVSDVEKQRRERDEFFRILREKELASQTNQMNGIVGLGSPTPGPSFGSFSASSHGRNPLRVNTGGSDILPSPALHNFQTQSPIQQVQQSPFSTTGLGSFGGTLGSPVVLQDSAIPPVWNTGPHAIAPQPDPFKRNSPIVGTPQGGSPWHSIIEPSAAPVPSPFNGLNQGYVPIQNVWHNHTISSPQTSTFQDHAQHAFGTDSNQQLTQSPPAVNFLDGRLADQQQSLHSNSGSHTSPAAASLASPLASSVQGSALSEHASPPVAAAQPTSPKREDNSTLKESIMSSEPTEATAQAKDATTNQNFTPPNKPTQQGHSKASKEPSAAKSSATPPTESTIPPAHASLPAKPAWSIGVFDDKGALSGANSTTMSLRQIQEAEAKRSQELKKQEKERTKTLTPAAPAPPAINPSSSNLTLDTTTTSWGLPQVGKAAASAAVATSAAPSPSLANSAVPGGAWTAKPTPATKKTMKEIQEEEERRKKEAATSAAATREVQAAAVAAAKRGYADSAKTSGTNPSTPTLANSAWTTIGANGKATPTSTTTPSLSTPRTVTPTSSVLRPSTATSATSAVATPAKPPQAARVSAPAKPVDDAPSPSLEFVKWMREALKGLTGVNLDEFLQFLLQFPLEPASSDLELISDTVYSYSSTLDGRRFASEFVTKRKADAANAKNVQPKAVVGATVGTGVVGKGSLADVVKTQPKPAQTDFGYKVVNKKKGKNGRGSNVN